VTFENGSRLERIEESAFCGTGLKSILIPSSVVTLGKGSFCRCKSLESVTFENGSRLERIEESAFRQSGLKSIEIPHSVTSIDSSITDYGCETVWAYGRRSKDEREDVVMDIYDGLTHTAKFPIPPEKGHSGIL
jgi:hypothetical protein